MMSINRLSNHPPVQPLLSRGELRCIGATTLDKYRKFIEKDPALERRFQQVKAVLGLTGKGPALLNPIFIDIELFYPISPHPGPH